MLESEVTRADLDWLESKDSPAEWEQEVLWEAPEQWVNLENVEPLVMMAKTELLESRVCREAPDPPVFKVSLEMADQ